MSDDRANILFTGTDQEKIAILSTPETTLEDLECCLFSDSPEVVEAVFGHHLFTAEHLREIMLEFQGDSLFEDLFLEKNAQYVDFKLRRFLS